MKIADNSTQRVVCAAATLLFLLSLLPLLWTAVYSRPQIDDFYFGIKTYHTFQNTGSFWQTLGAAVQQVGETYLTWQGSFSAVFLFALHPGIWGESWYPLGTVILLGSLIFSILYFSRVVLVKRLGASSAVWLTTAMVVLTLSIHLLPSPVQSYYWWNGGVYYTFFYALSLVMFALLLDLASPCRQLGQVLKGLLAVLLALILGGGNYITALLSMLLLTLGGAAALIQRKGRGWLWLLCLVCVGAGLLISFFSPGNAIRSESYPATPGPVDTVFQSIYFGVHELVELSTLPVLACLLPLTLCLAPLAKKLPFSYPLPLLVSLFSFGLYCAQFAPPVYGMGAMGELRLQNVYFFTLLWWWLFNLFYWSGWLQKKGFSFEAARNFFQPKGRAALLGASCLLLFLSPIAGEGINLDYWEGKEVAVVDAVISLRRGRPQQWALEYDQRVEVLHDSSVKRVEFLPFTTPPYLLYYGDLTRDPNYQWSNAPMARYYGKESVVVLWPY